MSATDDLAELFVDVTGREETVTEREEEPSRDPVDREDLSVAEDVAAVTQDTGLDDAVAGTEAGNSGGDDI